MQGATDKVSKEMIKEMIEMSNMKKQARLRTEREPKISYMLENRYETFSEIFRSTL